jgi:hypothetical protein
MHIFKILIDMAKLSFKKLCWFILTKTDRKGPSPKMMSSVT